MYLLHLFIVFESGHNKSHEGYGLTKRLVRMETLISIDVRFAAQIQLFCHTVRLEQQRRDVSRPFSVPPLRTVN